LAIDAFGPIADNASNSSHFIEAFKKKFGTTPKKYLLSVIDDTCSFNYTNVNLALKICMVNKAFQIRQKYLVWQQKLVG